MRTVESIMDISLGKLNPQKMREAKAEAKVLNPEKWMEIYYERNLADPELHYEGVIPKALPYDDFDAVIDEIDQAFRMLLESL